MGAYAGKPNTPISIFRLLCWLKEVQFKTALVKFETLHV